MSREDFTLSLRGKQAVAGITGTTLHKTIRNAHLLRKPARHRF